VPSLLLSFGSPHRLRYETTSPNAAYLVNGAPALKSTAQPLRLGLRIGIRRG
jgi:hypothetical protein